MSRRFFGKPAIFTRPGHRRSWTARSALIIAALAGAIGVSTPARAALVIVAPSFTAQQGSSGVFDVLITNTNAVGGASYDVAGDLVQLSVSGPAGVSFTLASIGTLVDPYIYVNSGTLNGGGPLSTDTFPNTTFQAIDSEFQSPGFRTIGPGNIFGIVHVGYSITGNAALGLRSLVLGPNTGLSDINGASIPFTGTNGSITVTAAPSSPEPSSLLLLASGMGLGLVVYARRKRFAKRAG
jgi:hypothetical protein